jgi:hypothetical protein
VDAHELVSQEQVLVPNFLSYVSTDFFGDFDRIKDSEQTQIRNVLQNVGTVTPGSIFNPFTWTIKVRCEERPERNLCSTPTPEDPCGNPGNPNPPPPPGSTAAYTVNQLSTINNPEIMFCPVFFRMFPLKEAMVQGSNLPTPWNYHLDNFSNQAWTFLHELFHVHLAADSFNGSPNPEIDDIKIPFYLNGALTDRVVYRSRLAKILAKYDSSIDPYGSDAGFYTQRNGKPIASPMRQTMTDSLSVADSYALFCMAWYAINQLG